MKKLFSAITAITYHNICCIWTRYEESSKIGKVEARDQLLLVLLILSNRSISDSEMCSGCPFQSPTGDIVVEIDVAPRT